MAILNPVHSVSSLFGDLGDSKGTSYVTCSADDTAWEKQTITCPTAAGAAQGDYFYFTKPDGVKSAIWLDKNAAGTAPSGANYVASTNKVKASIVTGNSAIQVGAAVKSAMASAAIAGVSVTDNLDGTLTIELQQTGTATFGRKSSDDGGNGSFTLAQVTAGVLSSLQNRYITFHDKDGNHFNAWMNFDSLGSNQNGAGTDLEVVITSKSTAAQIATAIAAVIDARSEFESASDGPRIRITVSSAGSAAYAGVGNTLFSAVGINAGFVGLDKSSTSVASLNNNPSS